jgi:hypothetical protein
MTNIPVASILSQFELVEQSLQRAKLPFETNMLQPQVTEVSIYEILKARQQLYNIIEQIGHPHLGKSITIPKELTIEDLSLCPYCGNPECQSDHK